MIARAILTGRGLVVLTLFLSAFPIAPAWAQSVSLAWNPSPSPTVAGYDVFYGLASGNYTSINNAGTNTSLTVSGMTPGDTYYFAVLAYDAYEEESAFSNEVTDTIPMPPLITTEPLSQEAIAGAAAVFAVSAASTVPMIFQWFDGATALSGATNATLTVPDVSDANGGGYSVVISNSSGSVTSSVVTLSVIDPPVITSQPVAQSAGVGGSVLFQVAVSGTPPFTFQWFDGGTAIGTGTNQTLQLANVSGANAGNYYATVQNAAGAATSANAALTITNAFALLAGAYNGLFYQTNGGLPDIAVQTAGMLGNCIVGTNGTYSARVYVGGFGYPLTGALNATGNDSEVVSRAAKGLSNLNVTLNLDMTGATETITGLVSNMSTVNPWTAPLLADLATNTLPVPAGNFGMLIAPEIGALNSPTNYGDVLITSTTNGIITLAGYLADETPVSKTVPVSEAGTIPLYCSLYGGLGLAEGWINLAGGVPTGTITWIRPAGITNGLPFPPGFTNVLTVSASKHFVRKQYVHQYTGTSVTITPTAGDCLVAFAQANAIATLTVSDGVNRWVTQQKAQQTSGELITVVAATALDVAGGAVTVSFTGSSADAGITVIEYSGVTGIDASAQATTTATLSVVLNTAQTDMFVWGWGDEEYGADTCTGKTLNPGDIAPALIEHDTEHYDAEWDVLNSGAGFSAGAYTNTFVGSANGCLVVLALK
jgi:hypothetical protein